MTSLEVMHIKSYSAVVWSYTLHRWLSASWMCFGWSTEFWEALCCWPVSLIQRQWVMYSFNECNISVTDWEEQAIDRSAWRGTICNRINYFETHRVAQTQNKNKLLPETEKSDAYLSQHSISFDFTCPVCRHVCPACIRLFSHLKTLKSS